MDPDRKRDDAEPIIRVFITVAQAEGNKRWMVILGGKRSSDFETKSLLTFHYGGKFHSTKQTRRERE